MRETLANGGEDAEAPTFFACLGVMVYLPNEAVEAIFRVVALFSKGLPDGVHVFAGRIVRRRVGDGEGGLGCGGTLPTYHDPEVLYHQLLEIGYSRVAILTPEQAADLYYSGTGVVLPPPRRAGIACAYV